MGKIPLKLFGRLRTRDISGMSPYPLSYPWQLFFLTGKNEQEIIRSRMWACIFRVKWCTVGMYNAMAQTFFETNSSGDVSLGKEKAPLPRWICLLNKSGLMIFSICYHAGSNTHHFPRPKVKHRKEESSQSDALTPKKRKTLFAGKMKTYLWACSLASTP